MLAIVSGGGDTAHGRLDRGRQAPHDTGSGTDARATHWEHVGGRQLRCAAIAAQDYLALLYTFAVHMIRCYHFMSFKLDYCDAIILPRSARQ